MAPLAAAQSSKFAKCMPSKLAAGTSIRSTVLKSVRVSRHASVQVLNAVKFDYDTQVFEKELVKFADTEEYIYRYDCKLDETLRMRRGHSMTTVSAIGKSIS